MGERESERHEFGNRINFIKPVFKAGVINFKKEKKKKRNVLNYDYYVVIHISFFSFCRL